MNNPELAKLNFKDLLHYSAVPDGVTRSCCTGFCVSCEEKGYLTDQDLRLDQMSHGASTDDFENLICKLPSNGIDIPIAFLFEAPGGYYNNGCKIEYRRIIKQPPVNGFYWVPKLENWPMEKAKVDPKSYGPYLAYLIGTHKLKNAYFTNMVKCSLAKKEKDQFVGYYVSRDENCRDSKIRNNCFSLFLERELQILRPKIVFYFGQKVEKMGYYLGLSTMLPHTMFERLHHPAARVSTSRIRDENDNTIRQALTKYQMSSGTA